MGSRLGLQAGYFLNFFPGSISEIQQFPEFLNSFQGIFCTICAVSKFSKVLVEWKETIENGERENDTSTSIDANYCFKDNPTRSAGKTRG